MAFTILSVFYLLISITSSLKTFTRSSPYTYKTSKYICPSGGFENGDQLLTPTTISEMMLKVGRGIVEAQKANLTIAAVDIPLPVTGGTELDDWPGGIKQKYATLKPMLFETMRAIGFTNEDMNKREFVGGEIGEEDAVGIWKHKGISIIVFPTTETIPYIKSMLEYNNNLNQQLSTTTANTSTTTSTEKTSSYDHHIIILVNQQFFLDPLSKKESIEFVKDLPYCYLIENLNMKGPGALPVRGLLYRQYPYPYKAARRIDSGQYIVLKSYTTIKPDRNELETLFFEDSKERDKNLSFFDRLKRQLPSI